MAILKKKSTKKKATKKPTQVKKVKEKVEVIEDILPENSLDLIKFFIQASGDSVFDIILIFPPDSTEISPSIICSRAAS